ncbi:hypothetical protein ACH4G3_41185 [Streptomyces afghaniensis]|uniref:hypothetical protein n=1 Tax=Streptomyces afghaniensis TaxID=66865 RepID=UPI0037876744
MVRECREELGIEAVASPITGELPLFLTVTRTRGDSLNTPTSRSGTFSMPTLTPPPPTTAGSSKQSGG